MNKLNGNHRRSGGLTIVMDSCSQYEDYKTDIVVELNK